MGAQGLGSVGFATGQGVRQLLGFLVEREKQQKAEELVDAFARSVQTRQELLSQQPPTEEEPVAEEPAAEEPIAGEVSAPAYTPEIAEEGPIAERLAAPTPVAAAIDRAAPSMVRAGPAAALGSGREPTAPRAKAEPKDDPENDLIRKMFDMYAGTTTYTDGTPLPANLSAARQEAARLYKPGTPEYVALANELAMVQAEASNRIVAQQVGARLRSLGSNATDADIEALGYDGTRALLDQLTAMPEGIKYQVVTTRGVDPMTGMTGEREELVEISGPNPGRVAAVIGNPQYISPPVVRTQDVNLQHQAKQSSEVDERLRNAVAFATNASKAISLLTPDVVQGNAVEWVRGTAGFIRSATSVLSNQFGPTALQTEFDPDNIDPEMFLGINTLSPRVQELLKRDARLRSAYAHLATLYFKAQRPGDRSMNNKDLQLTLESLGRDLNDPAMMRDTLRVLVENIVQDASVAAAGVDLKPYDPYSPFPSGHRYNIMTDDIPAESPYYLPDDVKFSLRFEAEEPPGQTVEEFRKSPVGEQLEVELYDIASGARVTFEQIKKRLADAGLADVSIFDLNEMEFDKDLRRKVEERLGLTTDKNKAKTIVPKAPAPFIQLTPEELQRQQDLGGIILELERKDADR